MNFILNRGDFASAGIDCVFGFDVVLNRSGSGLKLVCKFDKCTKMNFKNLIFGSLIG